MTRSDLERGGALVLLVALLVGSGACTPMPTAPGEVEILEAHALDEDRLSLVVPTCGGAPEVVGLDETTERVTVLVETTQPDDPGFDCLDGAELVLSTPLGDRALVDATTGQTVLVQDR